MAAEVPEVNHRETKMYSIYNCIFCNELLNGKSYILECLHIICMKCVKIHTTNSSVQCKCLTITKTKLIDYPIESPGLTIIRKCSELTCYTIATKICMICNSLHCKQCSKTHLSTEQDHSPDVMIAYPMKKDSTCCPSCKKKFIEVYCTKCLVMICSMCHLNDHRKHNYEVIENLGEEIKLNFSRQKNELESHNLYLDYCLKKTDNQIKTLESIQISVKCEINEQLLNLHKEIRKHTKQLNSKVDEQFSKTLKQIYKNKLAFKNLKTENEYYASLTESILKHDTTYDIVNLSEIVLKKLISAKNICSNIPKEVLENNIELKVDWEESLNNFPESIKNIGKITSAPIVDLSEQLNAKKKISNNVLEIPNEPVLDDNDEGPSSVRNDVKVDVQRNNTSTIEDDYDDNSDYEPILECSCCNQWSDKLIQCISCNRSYHNHCHIPVIPNCYPFTAHGSFTSSWKCTMCEDISIYCTIINQNSSTMDISLNQIEGKLIERLLMELYCQNNDSEHFRNCPDQELEPAYYKRVSNPISLNDIKNRLNSDKPYTLLSDVIKDLKRVFSNAMLHYPLGHPYYRSAYFLQEYLIKQLAEWIPNLSTLHEPQPDNND